MVTAGAHVPAAPSHLVLAERYSEQQSVESRGGTCPSGGPRVGQEGERGFQRERCGQWVAFSCDSFRGCAGGVSTPVALPVMGRDFVLL